MRHVIGLVDGAGTGGGNSQSAAERLLLLNVEPEYGARDHGLAAISHRVGQLAAIG